MQQVRHYASKGDLHKARTVAKQIAHFRTAADRNFEGATMIATRAQVRDLGKLSVFVTDHNN
jgi:hypothetical protein